MRECVRLLCSKKSTANLRYYLNYVWMCSEPGYRLRNTVSHGVGLLLDTLGKTVVGSPSTDLYAALAEAGPDGESLVKLLIANTDYSEFLSGLYQGVPGLSGTALRRAAQSSVWSRFGVADFYSKNARALGHEAHDIYVNNLAMQRAWMREHGTEATDAQQRTPRYADWSGYWARDFSYGRWLFQRRDDEGCRILAAQVAYHRPDVFLNQAMDGIDSAWMYRIKPWVRLLVGQHAATTLPDHGDYRCYDLVVSSFPPTVEFFARKGIPAVLHRLGFDPDVLAAHPDSARTYPVTLYRKPVGRPYEPD